MFIFEYSISDISISHLFNIFFRNRRTQKKKKKRLPLRML